MAGPYRLLAPHEGTSAGADELRASFPVQKVLLVNDDNALDLVIRMRLRDGSEAVMTIGPEEVYEEELKVEVLILVTAAIAYRCWMYGSEGIESNETSSS